MKLQVNFCISNTDIYYFICIKKLKNRKLYPKKSNSDFFMDVKLCVLYHRKNKLPSHFGTSHLLLSHPLRQCPFDCRHPGEVMLQFLQVELQSYP